MGLMYKAVQKLAKEQGENRVGAGFLFGIVRSEVPLEIEIDEKITLEDKFLVVAEHLSDYEIPFEFIKKDEAKRPDAKDNKIEEVQKVKGFFVNHEGRQNLESENGELEDFTGEGTIKLLNHLREGDKVILMRMIGGHMYIVIDRLKEEEEI